MMKFQNSLSLYVTAIEKESNISEETREAFPAVKICKEGLRKVFNVWNKSHFSNFEMGWRPFPLSRKMYVSG